MAGTGDESRRPAPPLPPLCKSRRLLLLRLLTHFGSVMTGPVERLEAWAAWRACARAAGALMSDAPLSLQCMSYTASHRNSRKRNCEETSACPPPPAAAAVAGIRAHRSSSGTLPQGIACSRVVQHIQWFDVSDKARSALKPTVTTRGPRAVATAARQGSGCAAGCPNCHAMAVC